LEYYSVIETKREVTVQAIVMSAYTVLLTYLISDPDLLLVGQPDVSAILYLSRYIVSRESQKQDILLLL